MHARQTPTAAGYSRFCVQPLGCHVDWLHQELRCSHADLTRIKDGSAPYRAPTAYSHCLHPLQDHIVAGTLLTKRDTFLSRGDFMQLVYAACTPARPGMKDPCNLPCPLPALLKPEPLYTGKQVSSTCLGCLWPLLHSMKPMGCRSGLRPAAWGLLCPAVAAASGQRGNEPCPALLYVHDRSGCCSIVRIALLNRSITEVALYVTQTLCPQVLGSPALPKAYCPPVDPCTGPTCGLCCAGRVCCRGVLHAGHASPDTVSGQQGAH